MLIKEVANQAALEVGLDARIHPRNSEGAWDIKTKSTNAAIAILNSWWAWHTDQKADIGIHTLKDAKPDIMECYYFYKYYTPGDKGVSEIEYSSYTNSDISNWLSENYAGHKFLQLRKLLFRRYVGSILEWWKESWECHEDIQLIRRTSVNKGIMSDFPLIEAICIAIDWIIEVYFWLIVKSEQKLSRKLHWLEIDALNKYIRKRTLYLAQHHNIVSGAFANISCDDIRVEITESWNLDFIDDSEVLERKKMELIAQLAFIRDFISKGIDINTLESYFLRLRWEEGDENRIDFLDELLRITWLLKRGEIRHWCPALYVRTDKKNVLDKFITEVIHDCEHAYVSM